MCPAILQLIVESKWLKRAGFRLPDPAHLCMLQEGKFKGYYDQLKHMLREYTAVIDRISPALAPVLQPLVKDVEIRMVCIVFYVVLGMLCVHSFVCMCAPQRPGLTLLSWTSMNIDSYLTNVHSALDQLRTVISNVIRVC